MVNHSRHTFFCRPFKPGERENHRKGCHFAFALNKLRNLETSSSIFLVRFQFPHRPDLLQEGPVHVLAAAQHEVFERPPLNV